jgi:hypothetical protein
MAKSDVLAIGNLGAALERAVGKAGAAAVMEGSKALTASSAKATVTRWVGRAIVRLDETADARTRRAVMRECGNACAARHDTMARSMRRRYAEAADLDSFLVDETRRFGGGLRYERQGRSILHVYEPGKYRHPTRCYCGLAKGLKPTETLSKTFCECSAGFVEYTWSTVLGRPVSVKLLESAVTGGTACRFLVTPGGKR